jgi:amino acid permease
MKKEIDAEYMIKSLGLEKKPKLSLYGVVTRLIYAVGNFVLAMVFIVLVVPLNLAYIITGIDYALKYINWADNVFKQP